MSLLTDLISYWKLDGDSVDVVSANDGTDTDITYSVPNGKINQGAGFNGTTSKIALPSTGFPSGSGARSFTAWIKPNSFPEYVPIIQYGTNSANHGMTWNFNGTVGNLIIGKQGANASAASSTAVSTGVWNFVAVTIDASGNIVYYLNGSADGTATLAGIDTTLSLAVMGSQISGWFGPTFFDGAIDEVGIWSRALSSPEVTQLYNGGTGLSFPYLTGIGTLIDGYYKLDGNSTDSVGSNNGTDTGIIYGGAYTGLIDSFSEANVNDYNTLYNGVYTFLGQSFTNTNAGVLDSAKFYLKKSGSPTGSVYAKVYAHTGTYGTSGCQAGKSSQRRPN